MATPISLAPFSHPRAFVTCPPRGLPSGHSTISGPKGWLIQSANVDAWLVLSKRTYRRATMLKPNYKSFASQSWRRIPDDPMKPPRAAANKITLLLYKILLTRNTSEQGFALAFVIIAGIMVVVGAVMLAARANFSLLGSNRQFQYNTAREAAEYGFSEAAAQLNENQYGYLLVTNWDEWQNSNALPTGTTNGCDIAIYGADPTAKFNGIASNTSNQTVSLPANANARYSLINYQAPRPVNTACGQGNNGSTRFGNLWGGDAQLTVRGELLGPGQEILATYTLRRKVHVKAFAGPGNGESSLVINSGSDLKSSNLYYDADLNGSYNSPPDSWLDIYCASCNPSSTQAALKASLGISTSGGSSYGGYIYAGSFNYPEFPQPNLTALTAVNLSSNLPYYPYTTSALTTLQPECRQESLQGVDQVACKIGKINPSGNNTITVQTGPRPVSIFVTDIGANVINIGGNNSLQNSSTDLNDFARLRIYGAKSSSSTDCTYQTTSIAGTNAIRGAFLWFPNGTLSFTGGGNQAANYYGVLWGCKYTANSNSVNFIGPSNGTSILQSALNSTIPLGTVRYRAQGVMEPN